MNPLVLDLIIKGLTSLPSLIDAGINVTNRVQQLIKLSKEGDTMSDSEIAQIRADFDKDLAEFNSPME